MHTLTDFEDQNLLIQVAKGNERAFDVLYRMYSKIVYSFAFRILRSEELAEEVMQETLLKLWMLGEESANIENFNGYMRTAARNASLNLLRRQEIERRALNNLSAGQEDVHRETEERVLLNEAQVMLSGRTKRIIPTRILITNTR